LKSGECRLRAEHPGATDPADRVGQMRRDAKDVIARDVRT
jgi:hypothetical protein